MAYLLENQLLIGNKYQPTFNSNLSYFIVKSIDEEKGIAKTMIYPINGKPFMDYIELKYLNAAIETGDYKFIGREVDDYQSHIFQVYSSMFGNMASEEIYREYKGVCCARCINRKKSREWCKSHLKNERCYRFKFDQNA